MFHEIHCNPMSVQSIDFLLSGGAYFPSWLRSQVVTNHHTLTLGETVKQLTVRYDTVWWCINKDFKFIIIIIIIIIKR